jgi:hypothetical protein
MKKVILFACALAQFAFADEGQKMNPYVECRLPEGIFQAIDGSQSFIIISSPKLRASNSPQFLREYYIYYDEVYVYSTLFVFDKKQSDVVFAELDASGNGPNLTDFSRVVTCNNGKIQITDTKVENVASINKYAYWLSTDGHLHEGSASAETGGDWQMEFKKIDKLLLSDDQLLRLTQSRIESPLQQLRQRQRIAKDTAALKAMIRMMGDAKVQDWLDSLTDLGTKPSQIETIKRLLKEIQDEKAKAKAEQQGKLSERKVTYE